MRLFSVIGGKPNLVFENVNIANTDENVLPDDSTTRFPVKKTQITNYDDLNKNHPIDFKDPSNIESKIEYDPDLRCYIFSTKIGDQIISTPLSLTEQEYYDYSLKKSMNNYFKKKNLDAFDEKGNKKENFSLKDMKINIGPADKIFGPGGVKVSAQGSVEATMGFKRTTRNDPNIAKSDRTKSTFEFDEDIQLNVNASVGDKVNFGMNYDTKSMFDFDSKKINLGYQGKEDEIIKSIEAGNVSMTTSNSLINGGAALFGIKADLQFGKFRINSVISQQESESRSVNAQGGLQVDRFDFKADQYDENRHFFLAHYFRDNFDNGMSKIPHIASKINISRIEVWITNKRAMHDQSRNIVAFADLGEYDSIKDNTIWHKNTTSTAKEPYNAANDAYAKLSTTYANIRDISLVNDELSKIPLIGGLAYEKVESARLLNSNEYTFNPQLGYLSLTSALQADEVLAVAYEYKIDGISQQVGEFSTDDIKNQENTKLGSLIVKLLKPVSLSPRAYTWHLMMKNIYKIRNIENADAYDIQKQDFRLNISYQSDTLGTSINYFPEGNENIKNKLLLRIMNLDRLNSQNNRNPDGIFDFIDGLTINSQNGYLIFPVVEPFGEHLTKMINDADISKKYVYQQLYDSTKTAAIQIAEKNKFKISGSYRGSSNDSEINLNATNVPRGSVRVTQGGILLTEGTDYMVDYASGMVTIINQSINESNMPVQATLENRTFTMQRKTLMGTNLTYEVSKNLTLGGTFMHMYEKPLTMKTEIGNESVKNSLWGVNVAYRTESQWLTNLFDKLPLLDLTEPSKITFNGEFAHLIAGHYQNKDVGAYSYLDDFESAKSRIDLKSPFGWAISSTPTSKKKGSNDFLFPESKLTNTKDDEILKYGMNRSLISWYMIDGLFTRKNSSLTPEHIKNDKLQLSNHFVREIYMNEIYPNRDVASDQTTTVPTLNLSFYPEERGPYNIDSTRIASDGKLLDPQKRWGGITRKIDVRDFESSNVEYIEFWMMDPFVYNSTTTQKNQGGELYLNLGEISEDILKDGKKFYENGLPIDNDPDATEITKWGKVPTRQSTVYAFDASQSAQDRKKQDTGYNGLTTEEEFLFPAYKNYLESYKKKLSPSAIAELSDNPQSALNDPSGDSYHYFLGADYDQKQTGILDRYKYYNNTEGNSPDLNNSNDKFSSSGKRNPDVEDIDQDYTLNETEAYFEYRLALKPDSMKVGLNHIVEEREVEVPLRDGTTGNKVKWYQFKIPVRDYYNKSTNIHDFKSIRFIRMFMTQFAQPTHLRFGTFELVRGEWRVYGQDLAKGAVSNGTIDISTVNYEENGSRQPVHYVLPPGLKRSLDPNQTQLMQQNEQALSLKVNDLGSGDARAVYKTMSYDLRRFKKLQMFTHAEELIDGTSLNRGELTAFIRLGSDYKNNYYEYEIPLTITPPGPYNNEFESDRETVWPKENMFDFSLNALKNVKLNRNREKRKTGSTVNYSTIYSEYDPDNRNNKITVIGNPTLSDINVIMIGVRNNSRLDKSGEIWINELRLSDFDEKGGWAAQGNLNIALSDLGTIDLSGRKETVGFGGLDQKLMERRQDDYYMYNVATNIELGKFFPEKAKVNIPFYYAYSNQTTTPQYDPFDQDVTLNESLSIVASKAEKDSIKSLAQEKTISKSINFNNVKVNHQSKTPMPYDPANITLGYVFNQTENYNPSTVYDIVKDYRATLGYSYSPLIKTWEPFKNTKSKSGSAKFAKSLGFNYLPSNVGFNSNMSRQYSETLLRDLDSYSLGGTNKNEFLSWSKGFYWDREFNINWDFTRNLKFTLQTGTKAEIEEPAYYVNKKLNKGDYENWKDSVIQSILSLGTPLNYRQNSKITYQLPLRYIPALDWLNSDVAYASTYEWDRGADIEDVEIGNSIRNSITIDFKNRINLVNLYNKSKYLKKVNARFDSRKNAQRANPLQKDKQQKPSKQQFANEIRLREDTISILKHNLKTKNITIKATEGGKNYKLKYKIVDENTIQISNKDSVLVKINVVAKVDKESSPLWNDIKEYSARGLMSIRSIDLNFSRRQENQISGYLPNVGDAFGQLNSDAGMAPGLGFAFGWQGDEKFVHDAWDRGWLANKENNILPSIHNRIEKIEFRVKIEPIKALNIELNGRRENNERTELQYMFDNAKTLGGSFTMTTVALSSTLSTNKSADNYQSKTFDKFLDNRRIIQNRLEKLYSATNSADYIPGSVNANSGDVLIPAFIAAYTGRNASNVGLSAFPSLLSLLPNWTISYDGLSEIPFIKNKFKSIRLNHSYTCVYQVNNYTSFASWAKAGNGGNDDLGFIRNVLNNDPVPSSPFNISSVNLTEIFNPLLGAEGTLNNSMTIRAQYNSSRTLNLNMTSYQIIESLQRDFVIGTGYRINEFNRIIGIRSKSKDFNNDLNIKADLSYKTNQALIRKIQDHFTQATSGSTIITIKLAADYTMSRTFTIRGFFDRIINSPLITSSGYPRSESNFGISIRVTMAQ